MSPLSRSMVGSLLALGNTPADFNTVLDGDDNPFGNSNYGWLNVMGGMTGLIDIRIVPVTFIIGMPTA